MNVLMCMQDNIPQRSGKTSERTGYRSFITKESETQSVELNGRIGEAILQTVSKWHHRNAAMGQFEISDNLFS